MSRNLCLRAGTATTLSEAWASIDQIVDRAGTAIQASRDTLDEPSVRRIDERIESLNGLIEQFSVIDDRLQDFRQAFALHVLKEPFKRLRKQIDEFSKRCASHLVLALDERDAARARPTLPVPPPMPRKKFINTRFNGVLVGVPRLSKLGLETGLVDITSPLTNKVIATYHEKGPGIWVEHVTAHASTTAPVDLQTSLNAAQTLLDALPAFTTRMAEQSSQPGHTPAGIEFLNHQQASKLERVSSAIEQALTGSNATESTTISAATVNKQLIDAVETLYKRAIQTRLEMTRQQSPTPAGIEWLKNKKDVIIMKTVRRRRLKVASPTYLDEYTISDSKTRQALWYAHFHYSTSWTSPGAFFYARLKTLEEHDRGVAADTAKGLNEPLTLAFYRSMIGSEEARRLFFTAP